jgi:hypothetical protein
MCAVESGNRSQNMFHVVYGEGLSSIFVSHDNKFGVYVVETRGGVCIKCMYKMLQSP